MNIIIHPRPNPIIAAMYTLRDLDADVIIIHGPSGCGFMASRLMEEAGVHVVTTAMGDEQLIFGSEDRLVDLLREVDERFSPSLVGVVGTCASMIIGENLESAVDSADIGATVLPVESHGCMGANTNGAILVMGVAAERGIISTEEAARQIAMLKAATAMEVSRGMASHDYLPPSRGATKLEAARRVVNVLDEGGSVAVVLNAKKELAYRFADLLSAVEHARKLLGGEVTYIANLDPDIGLPRIQRYARDVLTDLECAGVNLDHITGGLDEYPLTGERAGEILADLSVELRLVAGLAHSVPGIRENDVLVTDQPRQLAHLLASGFSLSVGEISSHSAIMAARHIVATDTGDLIRQLAEERAGGARI